MPLTVTGRVAHGCVRRWLHAVLSVPPDVPAVLIDADAERPGLVTLGARIQSGVRVGLTIARGRPACRDGPVVGATRRAARGRRAASGRRARGGRRCRRRRSGPSWSVGACSPRTTCGRPSGTREGHIQRRPPAVLATWVRWRPTRFDHFAWGMTPELADVVDRTAGQLRGAPVEPCGRAAGHSWRTMPTDAPAALAAVLAAEPPRQPATRAPVVQDQRRAQPAHRSARPLTRPAGPRCVARRCCVAPFRVARVAYRDIGRADTRVAIRSPRSAVVGSRQGRDTHLS